MNGRSICIATLLLAGFQASAYADTPAADQSRAVATAARNALVSANDAALGAIRAQGARFSAAYVAGDTEALLQIYAVDGVAGPGGRDFVRGRDDLRKLWTPAVGSSVLRHQLRPIEIVVDGRHAYDWGYYEGTMGPADQPQPFKGNYLVVWQLDDDGQWRMAQDVWNRLPASER